MMALMVWAVIASLALLVVFILLAGGLIWLIWYLTDRYFEREYQRKYAEWYWNHVRHYGFAPPGYRPPV
jgi:hypothetical protein